MNARFVLLGFAGAILIGGLAACATEETGKKPAEVSPASRPSGAAPKRTVPGVEAGKTPESGKGMTSETGKGMTSETGSRPTMGTKGETTSLPKTLDPSSDTLNACMSRIPKDSPVGARMMAENSCRRDEEIRAQNARAGERASAGSSGDSLQACMDRIPKDATSGQRMLAEESCKRDEAGRR